MRSFARAVSRLVVAVAAIVATTMLLVARPLTQPASVAESTVQADAHIDALDFAADTIVSGVLSDTSEESVELSSSEETRLRQVIEDSFTPEWAEETVRSVGDSMAEWVTTGRGPEVIVDLRDPKRRIERHPDSVLLAAALSEPELPQDVRPADLDEELAEAATDQFLEQVPDEVLLDQTTWWSDVVSTITDARATTRRIGLIGSLAAITILIGGFFLSDTPRSAAATSWLGWGLLWVALPLLALTWGLPSALIALPLPDPVSIGAGVANEVWGLWRVVGWLALGLAVVLWGLTHVLRTRDQSSYSEPMPDREQLEPYRVPAGLG